MSAPDPSSIPTSASRPRGPPRKKRRALSPTSSQAATLTTLFAHPDVPVAIPETCNPPPRKLPPPPEIVTNVQGSSAGAGSGEFHVYKAARRREYERLRAMDEETLKEKEAREFEQARREREARDEEKTRKNREKREKKKMKGKQKGKSGGGTQGGMGTNGNGNGNGRSGSKDGMAGDTKTGGDGKLSDATNGATTTRAVPVADGPGLLIHDDD
ncbi:putative duf1168 domain protein [Echria macrotheca]|uniref:Duf1168 domain protein n=1 Tax=Echria macrotheca TaxID=438768 RepID=A0AAJ0BSR8_9PEZI|nr:putative duf1168 domain protein [Echria macrotheca]